MIEVFTKISNRMLKGLMYHAQWSDMFNFIGLRGYGSLQNNKYRNESDNMRRTHVMALRSCNKLIKDSGEIINEIPETWFASKQTDVDPTTIRNAVKTIFNKWLEWEKETKTFYEEQYKILCDNNKVTEAEYIETLIHDVQCEIECATNKIMEFKAVDYDMDYILRDQSNVESSWQSGAIITPY